MKESLLLIFSILILISPKIQAQVLDSNNSKYSISWKKDGLIFAAGVLPYIPAYFFNKHRNSLLESDLLNLNPNQVNAFDRGAIFRNNQNSAKASDYFRDSAYFIPLFLFTSQAGRSEWKAITVMYFETLLLNTSLMALTKAAVERKRPNLYADNLSTESKLKDTGTRSFYSGHTAHVATLTFFTAKVLTDLYPKNKFKWLWWSSAAIIPAVAGYLRYDAGKHFTSDIIAGYAIGFGVGYLIPQLHCIKNKNVDITVLPNQSNLSLAMSYTF